METNEILLHIRKKIFLPPILAVVTAIICFAILNWMKPEYRSTTSFYINQASVIDLLDPNLDPAARAVLINMAVDRVFLLANSDELRDSIVKDFDLYKHYRIDPNQSLARENVMLLLNNKIILFKDKNVISQINLTILDEDRFLAANIANKITERINLINRDVILKDVQKKLISYESTLSKLKTQESEQRGQILDFISKAQPALGNLDEDNKARVDARLRSDYLFNKVDEYSGKYKEIMERYYNAQSSIASNELKTITVIKKAVPEIESSRDRAIHFSTIVGFASLVFYFIILIFYYQNHKDIQILIGKEYPA